MKKLIVLLALVGSSSLAQISPPYNPGGGGGSGCTTGTSTVVQKGNGSGGCSDAVANTDYAPVNNATFTGNTVANLFTGPLTGNVTGNVSGSSATAGTAAALTCGTLLGDLPYFNTASTMACLPGSTTSTTKVLVQTGNGTISAAPAWIGTTGTGTVVLSVSPTGTGMATWARLALNQATGTAPMTITSTTPVTNLTVANHPKEQYCGTTTTCTATAATNGQIVYGSVTLSAGVAVVSGISPAFPDLLYSCTATVKAATIVTNILSVANTSVSSITITGAAATTDTVSYICVR